MERIVAAYCDGGMIGTNPSRIGGTWAFCFIGESGQRIYEKSGYVFPGRYDKDVVTNNHTEFEAMGRMLRALPEKWSGMVYSDSRLTIGRAFRNWKCKGIPDHIQASMRAAVKRLGNVTPVLVGGHPTKEEMQKGKRADGMPCSTHNDWCDRECQRRGRTYAGLMEKEEAA